MKIITGTYQKKLRSTNLNTASFAIKVKKLSTKSDSLNRVAPCIKGFEENYRKEVVRDALKEIGKPYRIVGRRKKLTKKYLHRRRRG